MEIHITGCPKGIFTEPTITCLFLAADAELFGAHVPRPWAGERLQHQSYHTEEVVGEYFKLLVFAIFYTQKTISKAFSHGINMTRVSYPKESSQSIQILQI